MEAKYGYVILSILILLISHFLRALRWKIFLLPITKINTKSLFSAVAIGYPANSFLPGHMGGLIRAFYLGRKHDILISTSLASILLERIIDVFSLAIIMFAMLLIHPFPPWIILGGKMPYRFITMLICYSSPVKGI